MTPNQLAFLDEFLSDERLPETVPMPGMIERAKKNHRGHDIGNEEATAVAVTRDNMRDLQQMVIELQMANEELQDKCDRATRAGIQFARHLAFCQAEKKILEEQLAALEAERP